jgi:AraC-like DNA-binding protein
MMERRLSRFASVDTTGHTSARAIPLVLLRGFFDELEKRGCALADVESAIGSELPKANDAKSTVPEAIMHRLFEAAVTLTGDETLGLAVGRSMDISSFHLVGLLALASANLDSAVDLAVRADPHLTRRRLLFEPVDTDRMRLGFRSTERSPSAGARVEAEITAVQLQKLALLFFTDESSLAPYAEFAYCAPAHASAYREYFPGGVGFEAEGTFLSFSKAALVRRRSGTDPALVQQLFKLAHAQFSATVHDDDWTSRVRRALLARPALRLVERDALAAQLGVSGRGLMRRLAREGTNLTQLVDGVLYERARDLLHLPGATSSRVADELGYAEVSSFFRAFRRWSGGMTPSEFVRGKKPSAKCG